VVARWDVAAILQHRTYARNLSPESIAPRRNGPLVDAPHVGQLATKALSHRCQVRSLPAATSMGSA